MSKVITYDKYCTCYGSTATGSYRVDSDLLELHADNRKLSTFKDCIFIRVIHEKCTPWLLDHIIVLKLMCCLVVLLHVSTFKIVSFSLQFCQLVKEKEYLFI